jgi:uncharacterized damage-inducible protein DinB
MRHCICQWFRRAETGRSPLSVLILRFLHGTPEIEKESALARFAVRDAAAGACEGQECCSGERFNRTPADHRASLRFSARTSRALANEPGKVRLPHERSANVMTKDDIELLYEYDRWANHRVLQAVSALSVEEFARDLGGSLPSVRDALVHIIGCEWAWLTIWKETSPSSAFVTDFWTRLGALFPADAFPGFAAVQLRWEEVEKEQIEFLNRVTDESLGRMLPVGTTQISLAHLMQHLANHSTYHRGQVALMMRQLAAAPVATDFAFFLMEGRREAGGRS